jgi:2-C-methyl-D-erythritol 4-phosphate cytidylyltransferase
MPKTCAIIPAAGRGVRMGVAKPKQFLEIAGKPILLHTLETLSKAHFLSEIVVVVQEDFSTATDGILHNLCSMDFNKFLYLSPERFQNAHRSSSGQEFCRNDTKEKSNDSGRTGITLVIGGAERQDSVFKGLQALPPACEWVLIHDAVRPFVSIELIQATWIAAQKTGAAIAALPATDTIKKVHREDFLETLPREEIRLAQTPQVFRKDIILRAYLEARKLNISGTDDAFFVERLGLPVAVVAGERSNIKITTPEDLVWGNCFLGQSFEDVARDALTSDSG